MLSWPGQRLKQNTWAELTVQAVERGRLQSVCQGRAPDRKAVAVTDAIHVSHGAAWLK